MNYVLLGLIIESIDKKSLAKSIRSRILKPLKMKNTFFEFYENPTKNGGRIHQYMGDIDMTDDEIKAAMGPVFDKDFMLYAK